MLRQNEPGFEWHCDPGRHLLTIRIWGIWDQEYAEHYKRRVEPEMKAVRMDENRWCLLVDAREFYDPAEDIQAILQQHVLLADEAMIGKRAVLVADTLLQFSGLNGASSMKLPLYSYFQSEESALQWLSGKTEHNHHQKGRYTSSSPERQTKEGG